MIYIILICYFVSTILIVEMPEENKSIISFIIIILSTIFWGYLAQISTL